MANLYLIAPTAENMRMESPATNAVLAIGADESAARLAVLTAAPSGSFNAAKFSLWTASVISAAAGSLPNGANALFLGGAYGANLLALPGA